MTLELERGNRSIQPHTKHAFFLQNPGRILTNRQEERIALALSAATAAVTGSGVGPGTGSSKASSASNSVAAVNAPTTGTTSSPSAASGDGSLGRASSTSFSSDVLRAGGSGGGGGLLGTVKGVTEGDVWLDGVENVEHAGVEAESTLAQVKFYCVLLSIFPSEAFSSSFSFFHRIQSAINSCVQKEEEKVHVQL